MEEDTKAVGGKTEYSGNRVMWKKSAVATTGRKETKEIEEINKIFNFKNI